MIKIFLTVRNRLAITKKCIEALKKHSTIDHQIYIYDNLTNYKVKEHHEYFYNLLKNGLVSQVTFNTQDSTFNAFSKAVSCNQFGYNHMMDPKWKECDFLSFIDNDIIVTQEWDQKILEVMALCKSTNRDHIHVFAQYPGGIKGKHEIPEKIRGKKLKTGKLGGSGFWNVRTSFFKDVGYLDLKLLVGLSKRHDQLYWALLEKASKGKDYIIGLEDDLRVHCGMISGSVCNVLTKNRTNENRYELIKFKDSEDKIDNLSFDEFMKTITNNTSLDNSW